MARATNQSAAAAMAEARAATVLAEEEATRLAEAEAQRNIMRKETRKATAAEIFEDKKRKARAERNSPIRQPASQLANGGRAASRRPRKRGVGKKGRFQRAAAVAPSAAAAELRSQKDFDRLVELQAKGQDMNEEELMEFSALSDQLRRQFGQGGGGKKRKKTRTKRKTRKGKSKKHRKSKTKRRR
jgi:hypothetical protein